MKIKENYILQNIADKWVVINVDSASVDFNRILALNETGRLLWEKLADGARADALADALTQQFGADPATAKQDTDRFIRELKELGCMDDEN